MTSRDPVWLPNRGGRWWGGMGGTGLLIMMSIAGCSVPGAPASPAASSEAATPEVTASSSASGPSQNISGTGSTASAAASAPDIKATVQAALRTLVGSAPQPSREQIRTSLADAGFAPATVEVSAPRTPTGLAVDAMDVGVLRGGQCVMAQIRTGNVEATVLPALKSGRCFIGKANG